MQTSDQPYDYGRDSDVIQSENSGSNVLIAIAQMAQEQMDAQDEVNRASEVLEEKTAALKNIKNHRFPDLLMECGQKKLTTANNLEVELVDTLRSSISAINEVDAFAFLEEQGVGGIIKHEVSIELPKGDAEVDAKLEQIRQLCTSLGIPVNVSRGVHNSTLCAQLRRWLADGVEFPMETFSAIVQKEVKVKPVKEKKSKAK